MGELGSNGRSLGKEVFDPDNNQRSGSGQPKPEIKGVIVGVPEDHHGAPLPVTARAGSTNERWLADDATLINSSQQG